MTTGNTFAGDELAFKAKLRSVGNAVSLVKDKSAFKYKYATLAQIKEKLHPALQEAQLDYEYRAEVLTESGLQVYSIVVFDVVTGTHQRWSYVYERNVAPQDQGSTQTYVRRYLLLLAFDLLPEEDDDGAAATASARKRTKTEEVPPTAVRTRRRRN